MSPSNPWPARVTAFGVWLLAAASVAWWGLRLAGGDTAPATPVAGGAEVRADPQAVARMLAGAAAPGVLAPAAAPLASRFRLAGVVAGARSGAAVISIDGQPARPYRVGAALESGVVLHAVEKRRAVLADAEGRVLATLELPQLRR